MYSILGASDFYYNLYFIFSSSVGTTSMISPGCSPYITQILFNVSSVMFFPAYSSIWCKNQSILFINDSTTGDSSKNNTLVLDRFQCHILQSIYTNTICKKRTITFSSVISMLLPPSKIFLT